jgi:glucose-6-phosphate 1-dehydrogenase
MPNPSDNAAQAAPARPCALVICGAAGDLTKRLLVPALNNLAAAKLLPDGFAVVGVARASLSDEQFRRDIRAALGNFSSQGVCRESLERQLRHFSYVQGDFEDSETYRRLADHLAEIERGPRRGGNRIFYLAVPPGIVAHLAEHLAVQGLAREEGEAWRRIILEKPFGTDLASAEALNQELRRHFRESQIYRMDHYLGKETVQNIMVLRFANGLFEPLWSRDHIDHVQITVAETVGVESRGKFYEATGALRDMVPNHLFQLLTLTAMEPPTRFDADAVRTEKRKVLDAAHRYDRGEALENAVRGQYGEGVIDGRRIAAYRDAPDVARDSVVETYVAMKIRIDNWRWAGVPFYLRTGKALATRKTTIAVKFKEPPFALFRDTPVDALAENFLVLRIQPEEGIALQFNAKVPGQILTIDGVRMDFRYKDYFDRGPSTGYETLIYDCMMGDATLFQRADEVEAGWRVVQPLLDAWRETPPQVSLYPAGSTGPHEAEALLARDGRRWRAYA